MATRNQKTAPSRVVIGGREVKLRYDYAALCELCDAIDATVSNLQERLENLKVSQMHLLLWVGMLDAQPDLKPDDVKNMLRKETISDAQAIVMSASDAFQSAMVRPGSSEADKADPQQPTADKPSSAGTTS